MNLFRYQPFSRLLIALIAGIYAGEFFPGLQFYQLFLFFSAIAFAVCFVVWYSWWYRSYKYRWLSGTFLMLFVFNSGVLLNINSQPSVVENSVDVQANGRVMSLEERPNQWVRIVMKPDIVDDLSYFSRGDKWMIMVNGPLNEDVFAGGVIGVSGTLMPLQASTNPYAFNYGQYLRRNGFSGQMFLDANDVLNISDRAGFSPMLISQKVRAYALKSFSQSGLDDDALSIINALLLGDRAGVDRDVNEKFVRSGAVHILAVSGLHVGIIYLMLNYLLSLFFKPVHPARFIISSTVLVAYAFITGFSPSVSRAVLMFIILQAGKLFRRDVNMYNLLCVSATLLLLINPMFLFHAGFWLSHMAVAGIVAFYPIINGMLTFRFVGWRWAWSIISVSVAAQITTFPFSIYTFGAFPVYFLLANLFILPVVAPVLILAFVVLIFSWVPFIAQMAGGALNDLILFMIEMVSFIESIPGAYRSDLWISWPMLVSLYLFVIMLYQLYLVPRGSKWVLTTVSLVMILLFSNVQQMGKLKGNFAVVYDVGRNWMVDFVSAGEVLNLKQADLDGSSASFARDALMRRISVRNSEYSMLFAANDEGAPLKFTSVNLNGVQYLIISGRFTNSMEVSGSYDADVVVLAATIIGEPARLFDRITFNNVVVTGSVPGWMAERIGEYMAERNIYVHFVRTQGAYVAKY
ncbi:ComEC/Rec2 family competence protein [Natronoflexus pectinivorans]|uniref:Competence protein ComEC n=1 Tax=Natronoflexus pectinivorans TaxID=682526 RepID=A0A4R2GDB4_9BACT|nr:ComEC/Rec2 family competence protein [Natronoflexus pectinivorans]TCO06075.1 competence protein ComEC [Natronoflexus pectinivorans]